MQNEGASVQRCETNCDDLCRNTNETQLDIYPINNKKIESAMFVCADMLSTTTVCSYNEQTS